MRRTARGIALLVGFAVTLGAVVACSGGGEEKFDINKGGSDAELAVKGFIDGWSQASGATPDQFAASQTRRFLGGDLGAMVQNVRTGGTGNQRPVEEIFNEIMKAPLPPDLGFDIVESTKQGDSIATVKVKLKYSIDSVNDMVKAGKVQPQDAAKMFDAVKTQPVRTLTLIKGAGSWQITKIDG